MKIIAYIKNNLAKLFFIFLILLNSVLIFDLGDLTITKRGFISIIFEIISLITFYFIYKISIKKNLKIEKIFIKYFVIIGIGYLFLFPVGSLPDETNHFMRAYEISNGDLVSKKCKTDNGHAAGCNYITPEIRDSIIMSGASYKNNNNVSKIKFNKKSKKFYTEFTNTSLYSFVCYVPQAMGIFVARTLNLPILYWNYMARLFNFAMFAIFIYISLKIIPYKKNIIMFISLLPITLQSAISISADCMTIAAAILLISYTLSLNHNDEKISKKEIGILFVLSTILSLCKIVYLPLCLFPIILNKNKFNSTKSKYVILGLIALFVVIINFIWLKIASDYLLSIEGGANPSEQINLIIHKPWIFLSAIYNTAIYNFDYYTYTQLGSSLGMFTISVSPIYIKLNLIILVLLMLFNNNKKINNNLRGWSILIYLAIVFLIYSSLYVQWTHVGNNIIDGIQGRYFIPILPLLFISFNNSSFELKNKTLFNNQNMLAVLILENLYVITHLINFY